MTDRRASLLMWIGVWAAPVAWALQHAVGLEFGLAACNPTGSLWHIPLRAWSIAVAAVAAAVATGGLVAAILSARATSDAEEEMPGRSRIHFMAVMGLTLSPLFLLIIILNGLGTGLGDLCRQA